MPEYTRLYQRGGCYFFTLVCKDRRHFFSNETQVAYLRDAFRHVSARHPFLLDAICVLPDHVHLLMLLPEHDDDFSTRIRLIKHHVSVRSAVSPWQPRFWEHLIRNEEDWRRHMDYIHYNPVKHGSATSPLQWPWSSFSRAVRKGWYEPDWGNTVPASLLDMELD